LVDNPIPSLPKNGFRGGRAGNLLAAWAICSRHIRLEALCGAPSSETPCASRRAIHAALHSHATKPNAVPAIDRPLTIARLRKILPRRVQGTSPSTLARLASFDFDIHVHSRSRGRDRRLILDARLPRRTDTLSARKQFVVSAMRPPGCAGI